VAPQVAGERGGCGDAGLKYIKAGGNDEARVADSRGLVAVVLPDGLPCLGPTAGANGAADLDAERTELEFRNQRPMV
jgi:hypothetical protein